MKLFARNCFSYGIQSISICPYPDPSADKEQSIRIQSSGGLSEDQIQQMVRDAEQFATTDKKRKEMIEVSMSCRPAVPVYKTVPTPPFQLYFLLN